MSEKFIQGAIEHPGSLKRYAKEHRTLTKRGTVNLERTERYVKRNEKGATKTRRLRQVNLAKNLRRLRA